jgi:hypothetical protein
MWWRAINGNDDNKQMMGVGNMSSDTAGIL